MKKRLLFILIALCMLVSNTVLAAPIQPDQITVRGLSMKSTSQQVKQVMGEPFRTGHYYTENYWGGYSDIMYEYPGVNFVFTGSLIKIILDGPQVALANGLKVGVSSGFVVNTLGSEYRSTDNGMAYDCIVDPVSYEIGSLTFVVDGKTVKKILIEKRKG